MSCTPHAIVPRVPCVACPDPDTVLYVRDDQVSELTRAVLDNHSAFLQCLADMCGAGGGVNDGGPYTVVAGPNLGDYTVTDTTSGQFFIIPIDLANGLIDADGDTRVTLVEGGAAAGGDQMVFTVDGTTVGSVEILAGGLTKWTLDGILDPVLFVGSPFNCPQAVANIAAGQGGLYVSDGTDGFTAGEWVKVENGVCSTIGSVTSSITTAPAAPAAPNTGDTYFNTTDNIAYVYDGTTWVPLSEDEVVENAGALAGAAPAFAKLGVDTTTGQLYYVVAGNWTAVPVSTVDLNTSVGATQAIAYTGGAPIGAPATPDNGDLFVQAYDGTIEYWIAAAGLFSGASSVSMPIGTGSTPANAIPPAADDATGAIGAATTEFALEDHKHPAQGVSADAGNSITVGTDGLHFLAETDEVIENAGALAGAAPAGAQWGVDTATGQAYYVVAGNWTAVPDSGGLVETVSGGATILHDGSGALAPTYVDNTAGVGTLVSNGNKVVSVKGTFNANAGNYKFNHDNPSGIVMGEAYLDATGVAPGARNPVLTSTTLHEINGLIGSNAHRFFWSF